MQLFNAAIVGIIITGLLSVVGNVGADSEKAELEKSPRHGEWVKVTASNDRVINAFVVYPEVKEPATSIIIIHEIFGLTDWIRLVADRLAADGFVAICPDLLSGMGPDGGGTENFGSGDDVRRAIRELPAAQVMSDLDAIQKYVRELPSTNEKVGVSGFCWGGGQTFSYAVHSDTIAAGFVFYGRAVSAEDVPKISAPVYGFYGESDNRINATIDATKAAADAANVTYEPVIYEGVGHAFLRRGMGEEANEVQKAATKAAWKRWVSLLQGL
ncbi:dienelactone hydrolase family protein [Candidatus Poribacteria bacterium]|nr:dienelactone hydrolase family protein [Candidatus Poribacteria bacterium]MYG05252.1 dienelactone hydrolase family protein [Candidatus Poribacteria bacterium]MYK22197.1 dienelactone hydrolase family protein [Candidatus Poribacteria bacterium]